MSNVRPTLIAYTTNIKHRKEFDDFRVTFSNPTFFVNASPEGRYDYFYTTSDEIRATYKIQNKEIKEFKPELGGEVKAAPKTIESKVEQEVKESKEEESKDSDEDQEETVTIPDDYAELSWPKLRSLASKFTDEKVNKERALEILASIKDAD
ncbi:hypothetical protein [Haliea sp.]|uniref:hypothetical protein n=1 Tax=Haliea sp. TaxID=1932666 RepID=UPI0025C458CD|nr:hypothetical protein [Haliea sp.]|tara:strand:- start:6679 stop:7134 length:456 start_codon:yes stop_codon:yes gene_type:complete